MSLPIPTTPTPTTKEEKIREVRDLFSAFLKERKQRQTPERFVILEKIYRTDDHFDADELYIELKQEGEQVSRATVYNTLELLLECDLVVRHQFGQTQAKYEKAHHYRQHDHLICLDCNHVLEYCDPRIQGIKEMVAQVFHFSITSHSLQLYGHCEREICEYRAKKAAKL
jgi:Fur family ferric uptake transcriptional regulator